MNPKMDNLFWFKIDMQDFRTCMNVIVIQSQNLTKPIRMNRQLEFQSIWQFYFNFCYRCFYSRFENLLNSVQNITYPPDSEYVHNALVNSLKYETGSYKQFRNYLLLGNKKRYHLISSAFLYEQIYSKFLSIPWILLIVEVTSYTNDLAKILVLATACMINSYLKCIELLDL